MQMMVALECSRFSFTFEKKLKEGEIIPITFDYVFCNIFNNPDNSIILENFLSCYLEVPLREISGHVL